MHELLPSDHYLGLPVLLECSRQQALIVVEDRIRSKNQAWKHKLLSLADWTTMVRSILSTISTYSMATFQYPKQFSAKLNSLLSKVGMRKLRKCIRSISRHHVNQSSGVVQDLKILKISTLHVQKNNIGGFSIICPAYG